MRLSNCLELIGGDYSMAITQQTIGPVDLRDSGLQPLHSQQLLLDSLLSTGQQK